jgi:hypothetical protein
MAEYITVAGIPSPGGAVRLPDGWCGGVAGEGGRFKPNIS